MTWQSTPWADPLLLSTVVSATLAVFGLLYVFSVRYDGRLGAFTTVMVGAAVWTLGYSFQFASADLQSKLLWATVSMVGEAVVPAAWFVFVLVYTRREEWLTPTYLTGLWVIPVLTILLVLTNSSHGLLWSDATTSLAPGGEYVVLERTPGPWLIVHGTYSYLIGFAGIVLMAGFIGRTRRIYRGQVAVLLVGTLLPAAAHIASLADVGAAAVVDLTPPSMSVLGVAFVVGIFRYRLFDLVPVARSSIVENMGEGYVVLDKTNDVVDLNPAARSLLDGDEGQLIGRNVREAFDADLSVLDEYDGGATTETITTGQPPDQRYLDLSVWPVEADQVAGHLLAVRDVTDRIRVERRFQTLIEVSSDIVFVLDETGHVDYASPSVERILGYDPDDLVGERSFEDLLVDDEYANGAGARHEAGADFDDETPTVASDAQEDASSTAAATWRRVLAEYTQEPTENSQVRFEVRLRAADGSPHIIEAIARYLVDDPAVEGIVVNARDVTERKERELELARTNERLDEFVGMVSHDLRNPLTVAMAHLEHAQETGHEESLEKVQQQHERMEAMIEDLLTMARDGRNIEETESVNLHDAVTRAWESVETGNASLVVDADATIQADESRLPNLFENLFRNAVEHGSTGNQTASDDAVEHGTDDPATLTVRVETLADGFAVEDDGVGIPPDIREEVTDSGRTTERGNTGYGLAIVDEIATAHGWDLDVTESDDGGARFEFTGVDDLGPREPTAETTGQKAGGAENTDTLRDGSSRNSGE